MNDRPTWCRRYRTASRKHPTHLTVDDAIAAAEQIAAKRTFFTHMTHDIRHAELDPRLPQGMALGFDGLTI